MKVLITGGCGFVGYHTASKYLDEGHEVTIIDNLERASLLGYAENVPDSRKYSNYDALVDKGARILLSDISKESTFDSLKEGQSDINGRTIALAEECFDYIIHLAAQCGVPPSIENPRRDFEVNALGTLNLLEYVRQTGGKMVYISTNKVYPLHAGWTKDPKTNQWQWSVPVKREHGMAVKAYDNHGSRTPYGASKFVGDIYAQEYHHIYGIPMGIFRCSCLAGTHQFSYQEQGWVTWFAIAAEKGLPINIFGDGEQVRDVLWSGDVVSAIDGFLTSQLDYGLWNLGGGPSNTLSVNECVRILSELTGKNVFNQVTYHDWRPSDQRIYTSDIRNVKRDLNWAPTKPPKDLLEEILEWVREFKAIL